MQIEGLRYWQGFLAPDEELELLGSFEGLLWEAVRMRGREARRQIVCFGWRYLTTSRGILPGPPVPGFLLPLRARAALRAGVDPEDLGQVILTRYPPLAGIGWHTDSAVFGDTVITISLASPATMQFRQPGRPGLARLELAPGSILVMQGEARRCWLHRIAPVKQLRFSMSLRNLDLVDGPERA